MTLISKALRMARVKGITCQPHHVYPQMELAVLSLLPTAKHHRTSAGILIPVPHRIEGSVNLSDWLHTKVVCPPENDHPSQYTNRPILRRPWIELTTIES